MVSITITLNGGRELEVDQYEDTEEGMQCPMATQDPVINDENMAAAVEDADYRDPANDGGFRSDEACGNCGAYNQTPDILECIGMDDDDPQLGYCQIFKFVCESAYTCNEWVRGGPITSALQEATKEAF